MKAKVVFLVVSILFAYVNVSNFINEKRFNENLFPYVEGNLARNVDRTGHNMKIVVDYPTPD